MAEVRSGVDTVDREIIELFAKRFDYMRAAARIKTDRSAVRDNVRKAQVIENARMMARDLSIPEDAVAEIWETLVEASITYELDAWDKMRR
jgi:isochorismate pyruvate lyase